MSLINLKNNKNAFFYTAPSGLGSFGNIKSHSLFTKISNTVIRCDKKSSFCFSIIPSDAVYTEVIIKINSTENQISVYTGGQFSPRRESVAYLDLDSGDLIEIFCKNSSSNIGLLNSYVSVFEV